MSFYRWRKWAWSNLRDLPRASQLEGEAGAEARSLSSQRLTPTPCCWGMEPADLTVSAGPGENQVSGMWTPAPGTGYENREPLHVQVYMCAYVYVCTEKVQVNQHTVTVTAFAWLQKSRYSALSKAVSAFFAVLHDLFWTGAATLWQTLCSVSYTACIVL